MGLISEEFDAFFGKVFNIMKAVRVDFTALCAVRRRDSEISFPF